MRLLTRVSVLCAIVVVGLTGCGGGSGGTVARVRGVGSITKAMVDHWVPIEAVLLYEEVPRSEVPVGVVPDPPAYSACIARLAKIAPKDAAAAVVRVGLKRECRENDLRLKVLALNSLRSEEH